jgi:hypothetical protein
MTANEPPTADQRRLAEYELAELNRYWAGRAVALGAVEDSPGGAVALAQRDAPTDDVAAQPF